MSVTTPPTIAALPAPPTTADPTNFVTRADAFLPALPTFQSEANALGSNVYANAVDAAASATSAASSAALAIAAGGATLWVSGTTYALGVAVISPATLRAYRRKIAGAGTTDPSADTTNWQPAAIGPAWVTKTSNYTAISGDAIRADTSAGSFTITLPAAPQDNDTVDWKDYAGTFATYKLTFGRNGKNIMGLAQDMDVSTSNLNGRLTFIAATNDWRF